MIVRFPEAFGTAVVAVGEDARTPGAKAMRNCVRRRAKLTALNVLTFLRPRTSTLRYSTLL
jgi:hypothetical protein